MAIVITSISKERVKVEVEKLKEKADCIVIFLKM